MTNFRNFTGSLSMLRAGYYNSSANSMRATLELNSSKGDAHVKAAMGKALSRAKSLSAGGYNVYFTGRTAESLLSAKVVGKAIGMADGTGMIFIVLLFGWQVRSWRLTLVPIFNTILCLLITEGLIYPLSASATITLPSFVPNVCLFLCIALSVDYSFFHLSRFQESRRAGTPFAEAVEDMVTTAGRVVLVSGVVLLFTWLALAAFPVFGTDSLGYCSSVTIFVCITVNLVMNPALALACPGFFSCAAQDAWHCCRRRRRVEAAESGRPFTGEDPREAAIERGAAGKNCYGAMATKLTRSPGIFLVPLAVYAVLVPAAWRLFTADLIVGGISASTPDTQHATQGILQDFPGSAGGVPLTLLLVPPHDVSIKSNNYFEASCTLARHVHSMTGILPSAFHGIMVKSQQNGSSTVDCLTWDEAEMALNANVGIYNWAWSSSVDSANTSSLLAVTPPFDAFSNKAKSLVSQGRRAVDAFLDQGYRQQGWTAVSFHPMAVEVDAEEVVAARFPWVVALTLAVVFSVIALRYRAALIPLKLFMTIALPILAVLGASVLVYQDGYLNWTHIPSLRSQGGVVWINPVACTFMLIGFALDYDIFLFSRIYAERRSGMFTEDRAAIIHAVDATGPVITTAGVIMALAFSGMVAQSANPFLCQMGFTMILGVLVDTFVVRTLLTPAILAMAGSYNWWPGVMPGPREGDCLSCDAGLSMDTRSYADRREAAA
jgi:uncharacterized membrane protein YdfJ with MMPL/SSD domain